MSKLQVEVAGVKFKYPIVVSAGPLTKDGKSILAIASQKGVGGIVTKTIYPEPAEAPKPSIIKVDCGLLNIDWSDIGKEKWLEEFEIVKRCKLPIIASVKGKTPKETSELAKVFQDAGASMIEVPIPLASFPSLIRLIKTVKKMISIPLIVKFGPNLPDLPISLRKFQQAGADAFSCINTVGPALAIDIESGRPLLGGKYGFGYLSGAAIKPLALACVAKVYINTNCPIFGGGGISSGRDAIEMLMAGATIVSLHTAAIGNKSIFGDIIDEISNFMHRKGFTRVSELTGLAFRNKRGQR